VRRSIRAWGTGREKGGATRGIVWGPEFSRASRRRKPVLVEERGREKGKIQNGWATAKDN